MRLVIREGPRAAEHLLRLATTCGSQKTLPRLFEIFDHALDSVEGFLLGHLLWDHLLVLLRRRYLLPVVQIIAAVVLKPAVDMQGLPVLALLTPSIRTCGPLPLLRDRLDSLVLLSRLAHFLLQSECLFPILLFRSLQCCEFFTHLHDFKR